MTSTSDGELTAVLTANASARELCERLEHQNGSTRRAERLEGRLGRLIDFTSTDDSEMYRSTGGPEACAGIVMPAVRVAAEIIERDRAGRASAGRR